MHNFVNHAVLERKIRIDRIFWHLNMHKAFNDTWSSKADQRTRLR
jgi:hypothetical protein